MDAELMEMITVQQAFEFKHAKTLKPLVEATENSLVKMFLSRIMYDTLKHADMFQALIDLSADKIIWNVDKQRMIKELKYHLETEGKMLKGIQRILTKVDDADKKTLLQEILRDEKRHHNILTGLINVFEKIDVSQEDWMDLYRKRLQEEWPDF